MARNHLRRAKGVETLRKLKRRREVRRSPVYLRPSARSPWPRTPSRFGPCPPPLGLGRPHPQQRHSGRTTTAASHPWCWRSWQRQQHGRRHPSPHHQRPASLLAPLPSLTPCWPRGTERRPCPRPKSARAVAGAGQRLLDPRSRASNVRFFMSSSASTASACSHPGCCELGALLPMAASAAGLPLRRRLPDGDDGLVVGDDDAGQRAAEEERPLVQHRRLVLLGFPNLRGLLGAEK